MEGIAERSAKKAQYMLNEDDNGSSDRESNAEIDTPRSLPEVLSALGLTSLNHNLPKSRKHVLVSDASDRDLARCANVFRKVMFRVSELIYPADPETFVASQREFSQSRYAPTIITNVGQVLRTTKNAYIERRVVRALLCASMPRKALNAFLERLDDGEQSNSDSDGGTEELDSGSLHIKDTTFTKSKLDWQALLRRGKLDIQRRQLSHVDNKEIEFAVRFIFSRTNIQLLSWGTKRVVIGGRGIILPAVTRKKKRSVLFSDYKTASEENDIQSLGRSSFLSVCGTLTARDSKRKSAVDYIVGTLVNDCVSDLYRIVKRFVPSDKRTTLSTHIECAEYFLKGVFMESHLNRDSDGLHNMQFALDEQESVQVGTKPVKCNGCLAPFAVVDSLESFIPRDRDDAHAYLSRVRSHFMQYYAHMHRVKAQQLALEGIFEEMVKNRLHNRVVMLADYKMKYEPIRYREKTVDFFGKKGISWHGIVMFHMANVYDDSNQFTGPEHLSMLFYDHIVQSDSEQDVTAVASIIEAGMMRLRTDLPSVNEVIILSDNAACYQNASLPMILPFIALSNNLTLLKFIHTETQDGKSLVDAHFAIAIRHVCKIVSEGNNVTTPSSLVMALRSGGGLKNTAAELVRVDRKNPNLINWESVRNSEGNGTDWIGRNNEYNYEGWSADALKVSVTTFRYSGNGPGRRCQFSRAGVCKPLEGDNIFSWESILNSRPSDEPRTENSQSGSESSGRETGVRVLPQSAINRILSKRTMREGSSKSRFYTAVAAVSRPSESNCGGRDSDSEVDVGVMCEKCERQLSSQGRLEQHKKHCTANGNTALSKTVLSRAVVMANQLIQSKDISIMSMNDENIISGIDTSSTEFSDISQGWARRTTLQSEIPTYVEKHRNTLQDLFDRGAREKSFKMSASAMREHLLQQNGERFDIPSETEIQKAIQAMFARQKKGVTSEPRSRGLASVYRNAVDTIVARAKYDITPARALKLLQEKFTSDGALASDFPDDKQVKNRVSALKTAHKKQTTLPDDVSMS